MRIPMRRLEPRRAALAAAAALCMLALCLAGPRAAWAAKPAAFGARAGLDLARAAAVSWMQDATLVYLENDEDMDDAGAAPRWGYVFYSAATKKCRVYSIRDGRILVAENLDMKLEAPPVASGWVDSGVALAAAEQSAGRAFRTRQGGRLSSMLLMRGAFDDLSPDHTGWTIVYTAPHAPSLFVVVDAAEGKVRRTWRG